MYRRDEESSSFANAEFLRRRRLEWKRKSEEAPINLSNLRADVQRIEEEIRKRKNGNGGNR